MNLEHTKPFSGINWRVTSIGTSAITTHALFRVSNPPLAFGVSGTIHNELAVQLICAIDQSTLPSKSCDTEDLTTNVNGFTKIACVHGADRHFLKGWSIDQPDFIHLIPAFECELAQDNSFPYQQIRYYTDLFDLHREPHPFFWFQMQGGSSELSVDKWSTTSIRDLESFIDILKEEPGSRLRLKNRDGEILELPSENGGWIDVESKVKNHLL